MKFIVKNYKNNTNAEKLIIFNFSLVPTKRWLAPHASNVNNKNYVAPFAEYARNFTVLLAEFHLALKKAAPLDIASIFSG